MKTIYFLLVSTFIPLLTQAQIPNSGFEDWTSMITYNNPSLWGTLNNVTASANTFTCVKGTPGNPGNSYIKLTSKSVAGMGTKPGIAVSGILNTISMEAVSGFPFTGRPEAMTGKWQYMANGADKGYISIILTHWNPTAHYRDTICYKYLPLSGMVMSWANFTIPVTYSTENFPDSAIIVLSASNANGAVTAAGSYLYVDNLVFKNTVWLSADNIAKQNFCIYPNPAHDLLNFELPVPPGSGKYRYSILNYSGLEIRPPASLNQNNINIDNLIPGCYILMIESDLKFNKGKFIKY
ncbi:MAG: T9SS type A sorting domain-containing protein [Bacteroidales bacterium]